jgi:predicted nucleic-acid-binding protein
MQVVDTNFILRYLLQDDLDAYAEAEKVFLNQEEIFIPGEIIAEIVYVMKGVYSISKEDIQKSISSLIQNSNIILYDKDIIELALKVFSETNLDYPDCLLYGYNKLRAYTLHTFDKGLKKKL